MDFKTIGIDNLLLSLKVDELMKIDFHEKHEQPSHGVEATVVPENTPSKPISKEKFKMVEPSAKPSPYKKMILDSPREVENEPIPVLYP